MIVDHENRFVIAVPMGIGAGPWLKRVERDAKAGRTTLSIEGGYHNMTVPESAEDYDLWFMKAKTQRRVRWLWEGRAGRPWELPGGQGDPWDSFEDWLEFMDGELEYWLDRCVKVTDTLVIRNWARKATTKRLTMLLPQDAASFPDDDGWQWATSQGLQMGMFLRLGTSEARECAGIIDINVESSWKSFFMHEEYFSDGDKRNGFSRKLLLSADPDMGQFMGLEKWPVRRMFEGDVRVFSQKIPADPYAL